MLERGGVTAGWLRVVDGTARRWADGTLLGELARMEPDVAGAACTALRRAGTLRTHHRDEVMIMEGARSAYVLLLNGFAKVLTVDRSGMAALTDIRTAGDVVGEIAAFDDAPRTATVVAAERMVVRRIGQDEWLRWVQRDPAAGIAISRSLAYRSRVAARRLTEFRHGPVLVRLASAILDLGERYGEPVPGGFLVRPALTQAEWGQLIGARERRVHHALHQLSADGALTFARRRITVHSLATLRGIASWQGEPC
ncbi:Crp/Fnr family transcriptional regulator [Streptomyces sp. NPDC003077]|uniref:Crp/Fnr family transcriptional regulator n=1 Tax=Streptomyces sp. NPDC003077 TaxID=3154443 RepID=UPI0033B97B4E